VIVDLTVEDDPDCAGFITDGLMSAGNVNNAKAAHADAYSAIGIYSFIIRAPMRHGGAHLTHSRGFRPRSSEFHDSRDAAHRKSPG
jgi:hypothetical protein